MTNELPLNYQLDLRAEQYYRGLDPEHPDHARVESAISDAITRVNEWSYEQDAHGYCHDRTDWIALLVEIQRLQKILHPGFWSRLRLLFGRGRA